MGKKVFPKLKNEGTEFYSSNGGDILTPNEELSESMISQHKAFYGEDNQYKLPPIKGSDNNKTNELPLLQGKNGQ